MRYEGSSRGAALAVAAALLAAVSGAAAKEVAAPKVIAQATFDFTKVFKKEPPRNGDGARLIDGGKQLLRAIDPAAEPTPGAVERAEARLAAALGVKRIDWKKSRVALLLHFYSRWDGKDSLELKRTGPGKVEARWTHRGGKMRTWVPTGAAVIERTEDEVTFAPTRWIEAK